MTTPENITTLKPGEVFVFGSNYAGRHGKGAALTALRKFGARNGQSMGLMGQSYGIATKGWKMEVLPLPKIGIQIERFLRFARAHPESKFFVTEIGCGLAGYHPRHIAPLFGTDIPENVILPATFQHGAESGTSNFDRELMEIEAEEHETIAQWLRGYYGSPVLAAQHEAKASNLRRQMEGANVRQPVAPLFSANDQALP